MEPLMKSSADVSPVIRPKWNTSSERGKKDGKEEVHRGADPQRGEATGSRTDSSRDAREVGVSTFTIYSWKARYGGMEPSEAARLHHVEDENSRLKQSVAEVSLDPYGAKEMPSHNFIELRRRIFARSFTSTWTRSMPQWNKGMILHFVAGPSLSPGNPTVGRVRCFVRGTPIRRSLGHCRRKRPGRCARCSMADFWTEPKTPPRSRQIAGSRRPATGLRPPPPARGPQSQVNVLMADGSNRRRRYCD